MSRASTASSPCTPRPKRSSRLVKWVCWSLEFIGLLAGLHGNASAALPEGVTALREARVTLMPDRGSAGESSSLRLPHGWDQSYPHEGGRASYRLLLPAVTSSEPQALFINRIGNQAEIWIDGQLVHRLGELGEPDTDFAKAPVWLPIALSNLRMLEPTPMEIIVTTQANRWGGVSAMLFGPATVLRPLYLNNYRWRQTASVAIVIALSMMALMAFGLWAKQHDALYGMLALSALFGLIRMGDRLLVEAPLPWPFWGALVASAFLVHLMLMARFALEAIGESGRWIRIGFWGVVVVGCIAAFASFLLRQPGIWTTVLGSTVIVGAVLLIRVSHRAVTTRSRTSLLLLGSSLVVILAGLRDFLVVRLSETGSGSFSILPLAIFGFVLCMGWIVVDRYSQQVVDYRNLNGSLAQRIAEREAELGNNYALLASQNEERATLQERQRIMRDIHDGVGAHLVSLLALVKGGSIPAEAMQTELHTALDELRVAVDSLQPVHGDLTTVLATLRYRLQPRLEAAGLEVVWAVDALPTLHTLTPQTVLQIQRILLEAFTNILRHAQASRVTIAARAEGNPLMLVMEVIDNGIGFCATDKPSPGKGMQSMRHRGDAIGASLTIASSPGGGTVVRIELPADPDGTVGETLASSAAPALPRTSQPSSS